MKGLPAPRARRVCAASIAALILSTGLWATASGGSPAHAATSRETVGSRGCTPPVPPVPATATPVPGSTTDWTLTSFDGTKIRMHWFPNPSASAAHPDPTLLFGPGFGSPGQTNVTQTDAYGGGSIADLQAAGYNVLTWDPRGFGQSGGSVEIDSPSYEARDVSSMIDWVATRPGVLLDGPDAPRVGMVGGSYGGGIQFLAAAEDCRIGAIVPTIAWHSLATSLDKGGVAKTGWGNLLYALAGGHSLDPRITTSHTESDTVGTIDPATLAWYAAHGPAGLLGRIHAPTLIIQGTVDTLFTLDEGIANYEALRRDHVPVSMIWFCGGHGACLTSPGDTALPDSATIAWLNRYLKGHTAQRTGPGFRFVDQNGTEYAAPSFPLAAGRPVVASSTGGTLPMVATGGAGPATIPTGGGGSLGAVAGSITTAKATNAVDVDVRLARRGLIEGPPKLTLTYRGDVPAGPQPSAVFAQVVDDATGLVLGNQITPIPLKLDGATHTTTVPLETVVFAARPGARLTLQLVATTVAYAHPRLGGSVTFTKVGLALPTVKGATVLGS